MRPADRRQTSRPMLLPSRANTRPDLLRYTSSTLTAMRRSASATTTVEARRQQLLARVAAQPEGLDDEPADTDSPPRSSIDTSSTVDEEEGDSVGDYVSLCGYLSAAGLYAGGYSGDDRESDTAPSPSPSPSPLPAPAVAVSVAEPPVVLQHQPSRMSVLLSSFHDTLETLHAPSVEDDMTVAQRLGAYDSLVRLVNEFVDSALAYAKIIILERHLPPAEKTIKPLNSSGVLGGDKFSTNGVYLKFARDRYGLFGRSDEAAAKVARHEVKSLATIMHARVQGLRFPLVTVVSYCGHTVIAMTVLPIDNSTLVYGTADAGKSFHFRDAEALRLANTLGERLNLAEHVPRGLTEPVRLPLDLEIHRGFDGRLYALDFSRLFPAEEVPRGGFFTGQQFFRLLRPELVKAHPVRPGEGEREGEGAGRCFFCSPSIDSFEPRCLLVLHRQG